VATPHTWDPQDYERHSAAQERWARDCVARLRLRGGERILDIGCGDGRVSAAIAAAVPSGSVLGLDSSPEMVAHARKAHTLAPPAGGDSRGVVDAPDLSFAVADAAALDFVERFDLIVSFNCLHWVQDQAAVLAGISRALVPGGRFFLHFAGRGNVAGMRAVVEEVCARPEWRAAFAGFGFPYCFPDADDFRRLVEGAGLAPERVELLEKPMEHDGVSALAGWVRTTWLPYLDRLPEARRAAFTAQVVAAYAATHPADEHGRITVDAVRLEAEGRRP